VIDYLKSPVVWAFLIGQIVLAYILSALLMLVGLTLPEFFACGAFLSATGWTLFWLYVAAGEL